MESLLLSASIVGCSVSILFSLSTVVVLSCFRVKTRPLKIKQHFAISIVLTNIVVLTGLQGLSSQNECRIVTILLHYIVLVCFGWICMDTYYILSCIRRRYVKLSFMKIAFIVWCFPVPFMLLALILGLSLNSKLGSIAYTCWESDHIIWALVIPSLCMILYSTYMLTVSIYIAFSESSQMTNSKTPNEAVWYSIKTQVLMLVITTVIWIFGVQTFWYPKIVDYQLIFGLGSGVQGLFLFFFYCVFCLELDLYVNDNITEGYPEMVKYDDLKEDKLEDSDRNKSYSFASNVQDTTCTVQLTSVTTTNSDNRYTVQTDPQLTEEPEKELVNMPLRDLVPSEENTPAKTTAMIHTLERQILDVNDTSESKENHVIISKDSEVLKKEIKTKSDEEVRNHCDPATKTKVANSNNGSLTGSESYEFFNNPANSSKESRSVSSTSMVSVMSAVGVSRYDGRASRSSNLSYASNMGMNELETLFNNPDLMNYSLPRKNRPQSLCNKDYEQVTGKRKPTKNKVSNAEKDNNKNIQKKNKTDSNEHKDENININKSEINTDESNKVHTTRDVNKDDPNVHNTSNGAIEKNEKRNEQEKINAEYEDEKRFIEGSILSDNTPEGETCNGVSIEKTHTDENKALSNTMKIIVKEDGDPSYNDKNRINGINDTVKDTTVELPPKDYHMEPHDNTNHYHMGLM
ncbi:origin recognition complex subunit 1-like isoform X2 [Hydractinia symbiolongicarpus]|uniref:origin recognition complex subunit 1-like isoform X2 n=1 Tax=Hydractinia symbiolongicarpus TaxID=13093 RepID=UPI00254C758C|nr:origin recognition complex subunit 1-like isoform X2 [Hydractinia symbiolongicarpus]